MAIKCEIKEYNVVKKQLKDLEKAPTKVVNSLIGEAKKSVPGWIATEVTKEYGIKKSEITSQKIGRVRVASDGGVNLRVAYTGRVLTPIHFGMSPKEPVYGAKSKKAGQKKSEYTLKYRVVDETKSKVKKLTKKQRAALGKNFTRSGTRTSDHSPIMLMPAANGGHYLPFQRKSTNRNDIEAIKTISLPQMVSSKRTEAGIQKAINENLGKRLDHYMDRYMG